MTILDEIVEYKRREELPRKRRAVSLSEMRARAENAVAAGDFVAALTGTPRVAIIAELKKASPSKGLLCPHYDPLALVQAYVANGASAVSVLTDERYFQGHLRDLEQVAAYRAGGAGGFGVLRKDFVVDAYQVYEARAAGADAVLLIAAALSDGEFADLFSLTRELGMEALAEVHDFAELDRVLAFGPRLVGANNRNLHDFTVDLSVCLALRPKTPPGICFVAESGIRRREDVEQLGRAGIDAVLVGEAIVAAPDPGARLRSLGGVRREEVG